MRALLALLSIFYLPLLPGLPRPCYSAELPRKALPRSHPEGGGVRGIIWRRQDYRLYFTKAMKEPAFITRVLKVSPAELSRAEKLLRSGIVRKTLLERRQPSESLFSVEKLSGYVVIEGPAELVVRLQTMVEDELTFLIVTREGPSENDVAVLSLVDPDFLQADPDLAAEIAEDNYEGTKRILRSGAKDYRRAGRRAWINRDLGTVTILDLPENIEKVREYLGIRPYAPRRRRY